MIRLLASPKTVGVVTGASAAVAVQIAQVAQHAPAATEWTVLAGILAGAVGWGIAWGTMRAQLAAAEVARKELKQDTEKVATQLAQANKEVAGKVEEHADALRGEMAATAREHRDKMDQVLTEVSALSNKFDISLRDTRQLITDHIMNCPAVPKMRRR